MGDARGKISDALDGEPGDSGLVPPPLPPDDPDAWYTPDVQSQYEVHPGVVVTISQQGGEFRYDVREPVLTAQDSAVVANITSHFEEAHLERPRTREGAVEVMTEGLDQKHERVFTELLDGSAATRRRVRYHVLAEVACLGELTPYALDSDITVADTDGTELVVHTSDYAPAMTDLPGNPEYIERFASERVARYVVTFHGFEIPVVRYRENVLGADPFTNKYAVLEPDLLPGDKELIDECKERIWETAVDGAIEDEAAFVQDRARAFLSRQLHARNTRAYVDRLTHRTRSALSEMGLALPPVDRRYDDDRLSDLVYYILRDYVGYGKLTIPIRDPHLEDIEVNRVGERLKVIPRDASGNERVPTNLRFDEESAFVNVVTQLAAEDGTELNASTPSAKVNLSPVGVDETIRCAVALPTISEDGPHISIRKQAADVLTPVDLVNLGSLPTELVALLWLCYEHHGVVLFSGPTGVGKTTLMNAHMPFIPFEDRPISIDEGSREVRLPHETGVSLTTREHRAEFKRVTMADLMTECNYLNPDVEVIAEVNTEASFETFAESLNTGHGLLGTTHASDIETLVNRVVEQGLPPYLLREVDLVVFPRRVDGDRYVGEVVELLDERAYRELDSDERCGIIEKDGTEVYWHTIAWRTPAGEFAFASEFPTAEQPPRSDESGGSIHVLEGIAAMTDSEVETIEDEFRRKHRYVEHLVQEEIDDFETLFELLADLQTEEAATVERLNRQSTSGESTGKPADRVDSD